MLIGRAPMFKESEVTDYRLYLNRREFMRMTKPVENPICR